MNQFLKLAKRIFKEEESFIKDKTNFCENTDNERNLKKFIAALRGDQVVHGKKYGHLTLFIGGKKNA